ncbi:hypothetical protein KC726_03630 [Candidatus Woesebacteria bacterium]|nr:hypothetical protein [Candidatus Woesebacteria bacterium]
MEDLEALETNTSSSDPSSSPTMTLKQAIDMGEYKEEYLSAFPEWQRLSNHIRWQLIRKAIEIRHKQLITHYAELNNVLNLSKKPYMAKAMDNVMKQIRQLEKDKETLYIKYSLDG